MTATTAGTAQRAASTAAATDGKHKSIGLALFALILGVFMAILDTSIINVAIPKIMAVFGVTQHQIEWVVTAYTLVNGALIPVTGYLGDRFGYKRMYIWAIVIFTIGSGLCGMAWSNESMIVFRIIQGIGGGALMPLSMAMVFRMFPPERRGMAMGLFGISIMFAPATGPTLSGYIVEYSNWRWIFMINVPVGILNLFIAAAALTEYKQPGVSLKFDWFGFLTSSSGMACLLYGVGLVSMNGWSDPEVTRFLTIGGLLIVAFIIIELNIKEPMLDLRLLSNFTFTISLIVSAIVTVVMMGGFFLLPIFLQSVMGLSAVQTGLVLLPQALMSGVMMPIAGGLYDKLGARPLAIVGLLITGWALFLHTRLDVATATSTLIFWMMFRAFGMGMMIMPIQTAGMNTVPPHKVGQGTALSSTIRMVASSFGVAWLGLLFAQRQQLHAATLAEQVNPFSAGVMTAFNRLQAEFASLGQSAEQAKASATQMLSGQIQLQSTIMGMDDVFHVTVWLCVATVVLCLFMKEVRRKGAGKPAHPMGE